MNLEQVFAELDRRIEIESVFGQTHGIYDLPGLLALEQVRDAIRLLAKERDALHRAATELSEAVPRHTPHRTWEERHAMRSLRATLAITESWR